MQGKDLLRQVLKGRVFPSIIRLFSTSPLYGRGRHNFRDGPLLINDI
jgi:hypothetical protein